MACAKGITVDIGCEYKACRDCSKYDIRGKVYDCFDWASENRIIGYDREKNVITISQDDLMKIIQLVNPVQKNREIELI